MESLIASNPAWNSSNRLDNTRLRMQTCPTMPPTESSQSDNRKTRRTGKAVEDLGTSFVKKPVKWNHKSGAKSPAKPRVKSSTYIDAPNSGSDDELDMFSSHEEPFLEAKIRESDKHLAVSKPPTSTSVYKHLKFKKIKRSTDDTPSSQASGSSSSQIMASKENENDRMFGSGQGSAMSPRLYNSPGLSSSRRSRSPLSKPQPTPNGPIYPSQSRAKISSVTSISNPRPTPRPTGRQAPPAPNLGSSTKTELGSPRNRKIFSGHKLSLSNISAAIEEGATPVKQLSPRTKEGPKPASFPLLSPIHPPLHPADFPSLDPLGSQEKPITNKNTLPRKGRNLARTNKLRAGATPSPSFPSPKGSGGAKTRSKQSEKLSRRTMPLGPEGSNGDTKQVLKVKPFPMSTQVLDSIGSSSVVEVSGLGKRLSSGSESGGERKKRREDDVYQIMQNNQDYEEEDTLIISPSTDPRTLCPYCDAPLPSSPTPLLNRLLATTAEKSYREARPTNPLGRKAPFAVFIAVCQRHRFESQILPEAQLKGWPKSIDWAGLGKRVAKMKDILQILIADSNNTSSRSKCLFWKEVMAEVKKRGSKAVAGVQGQFASFEKTQPGYYGELGSVIIHQTLYDLFPPASIDPTTVAPLTPHEFIQRILVPEVGVRLIIEDRGLDGDPGETEKAIQILRESTTYGVSMFPVDGGEEDGEGGSHATDDYCMGVADRIVMERAHKRRKELEADEMEEAKLWKLDKDVKNRRKENSKGKGRERGRRKATESPEQDHVTRPRPRPLSNASSTTSISQDDEDTISEPLWRVTTNGDTDVEFESAPVISRRKPAPVSDFDWTTDDSATSCKGQDTRTPSSIDINLCSSSDNVTVEPSKDIKETRSRRKVQTKAKKRVKNNASSSSPMTPTVARTQIFETDNENTPRNRGHSHHLQSPLNSSSHPLKKAQARNMKTPRVNPSANRDKGQSWLLSDSSASSIEPI